MYSHPALVRWLLMNGVDRSTPCHLKQIALDFVGECCEHTSVVVPNQGSLASASAEYRALLQEPASLLFPPGERVVLSSSYSSEIVLLRSFAATPLAAIRGLPPGNSSGDLTQRKNTPSSPSKASSLQQKIFKCLVTITWETPLSNGTIIDKYEIRYRSIVDDDGGDELVGLNGDAGGGSSHSESWRLERTNHNRKSREQNVIIAGLQFGTLYEFMIRSWNAVSKGE
ncbi:putative plasma membrane protein, partial [Globisporangium splendens]